MMQWYCLNPLLRSLLLNKFSVSPCAALQGELFQNIPPLPVLPANARYEFHHNE